MAGIELKMQRADGSQGRVLWVHTYTTCRPGLAVDRMDNNLPDRSLWRIQDSQGDAVNLPSQCRQLPISYRSCVIGVHCSLVGMGLLSAYALCIAGASYLAGVSKQEACPRLISPLGTASDPRQWSSSAMVNSASLICSGRKFAIRQRLGRCGTRVKATAPVWVRMAELTRITIRWACHKLLKRLGLSWCPRRSEEW